MEFSRGLFLSLSLSLSLSLAVSAVCSDGGEEERGRGHLHVPQTDAETLRRMQVHSRSDANNTPGVRAVWVMMNLGWVESFERKIKAF